MKNSGDKHLFYKALDDKRIELLIKLAEFKNDFYLAGGTALALQIGHRISVDFDFFTMNEFNNEKLINKVERLFNSYSVSIIQNEKDTITVLLNDDIKISFFKLEYPNLFGLYKTEYFNLATVKEIGIMKLLALFRATYKDYVDIYFILQKFELFDLIQNAEKKHPTFDKAIYIKALISFDDVDDLPIQFLSNKKVNRKQVFDLIELKTIDYINNYK